MKKIFFTVFFSVLVLSMFADDEKTVTGKLESATIFPIGAELVHTAKIALVSGDNTVVVEGLSASIDINSLQINCSGGATIMGSEFSKDFLKKEDLSPIARKLQDSIDLCNKEIAKCQVALETNKSLKGLLDENKSIKGTQNGLSVDELMKLMNYYKGKSVELETEKSDLNDKIAKTQERLRMLQNQLEQEKKKNDKISGRLTLKLVAPLSSTYNLKVSYYTLSAYWVPYYDIQATTVDQPIKMICKAKFMQTTGLDWQKVVLTLSTITPSSGKTAPVFNAWFLAFINNYSSPQRVYSGMVQNSISYKKSNAFQDTKVAEVRENIPELPSVSYLLEGVVISQEEYASIDPSLVQNVERVVDSSVKAQYGISSGQELVKINLKTSFVTESESQMDVTYSIDLPYSLLGTGKEQSVTLRTIEVPAKFEFYCAPKLDQSTYLLAGIKDWAKYNLLPGEINITYDGTYSGKSYLDPNSTRDILHLTLGNDKRVVVKREKMQDFSSVKFLGNDKKQVFTYQLTVKNTKNTPVDMILKDQYPLSTEKTISVEVLETSNAHENEEVGTLTWEFPLQPGETKIFKVSYSVKYPKDRNLNL